MKSSALFKIFWKPSHIAKYISFLLCFCSFRNQFELFFHDFFSPYQSLFVADDPKIAPGALMT